LFLQHHFFWQQGRAVLYIFSFPKGGKEKDAVSIPYAISFSEQDFLENFQNRGVTFFSVVKKIHLL
jgi:hypothetical protein